MPSPLAARRTVDACPGALRLHTAADGPLARVRVPGGLLTGAQVRAVRELAGEFGDGHVELTSRANLQLRGLTAAPAETLAARLRATGLLPSQTHELVRNIAASPLSGGLAVRSLIADLDRALCADPRLAELPGRFLFALDSGRLDVAPAADVAAVPAAALASADPAPALASADPAPALASADPAPAPAVPAGWDAGAGGSPEAVAVVFAGVDAGLRVPAEAAVGALLAAAGAFLDERAAQAGASLDQPGASLDQRAAQADDGAAGAGRPPLAWRIRELADGPARVAARTAAALGVRLGGCTPVSAPELREPVGVIGRSDGLVSLGAVVPLGRLDGVQLKVLERAETIVVTPWRGVLLPGLPPSAVQAWQRALADAGLEVESGSRWSGVTACAGRPGCAKALADVRRDAAAVAGAAGQSSTPVQATPVHWVGCARGCGTPAGAHVRVEATGSGYEVRSAVLSGFATADEVGELVAAARRG